jgi:hypothetical protein
MRLMRQGCPEDDTWSFIHQIFAQLGPFNSPRTAARHLFSMEECGLITSTRMSTGSATDGPGPATDGPLRIPNAETKTAAPRENIDFIFYLPLC